MTEPTFTKEQLVSITRGERGWSVLSERLAAFALALLDRVDEWEKVFGHIDKDPDTAGNKIIEARREIEAERDRLREELRDAEEAIRYVAHGDGYDCYRSESSPEPRGVVGYTGVGGVWFAFPDEMQAAVRRARERGGQGKQPLPK